MNRRDRTAVVFMRWCLAYLLLESVWIKVSAGIPAEQMATLLEHWLRSGVSQDWIGQLLNAGQARPDLAMGLVLAIEGLTGLMLALGIGCRVASLGCGLLYGLRYLIAPDGLALAVAMVAGAVFVSDSGKSLKLLGRRRPVDESSPQTNPL